ncbi:MAG: hypothetical protein ACI4MF_13815 [Candidatus Faecivicinus sp.]
MYIYTGGKPPVRRDDLIRICEMHPDCGFLSFANGTLIDEAFCEEKPAPAKPVFCMGRAAI